MSSIFALTRMTSTAHENIIYTNQLNVKLVFKANRVPIIQSASYFLLFYLFDKQVFRMRLAVTNEIEISLVHFCC